MPTLVLIRHGQSQWNVEQRFTGWAEPALSARGVAEGHAAGQLLAARGFDFDLCFTSFHNRAIHSLDLLLEKMDRRWLPVEKDWRLNERHYGNLTGLTHAEVAAAHGAEQVHVWRRSFDVPPPPAAPGSAGDFSHDRRYAGLEIPMGESLKETIARVLPYWDERIAPEVRSGQRVLICGHGNSLRGLIKHLSRISDGEISSLEIHTGRPIVYQLDDELNPTDRYYLDER